MYINRFNSYCNSAATFISEYSGSIPFPSYLKQRFAENKKYGSKDRRWIGHFCYCYFRVANAFSQLELLEIISCGIYICSPDLSEFSEVFAEEWLAVNDLDDRLHLIKSKFPTADFDKIFKFTSQVSEQISISDFQKSYLTQPQLFLRVRPGKKKIVEEKLRNTGLLYEWKNENCLSLAGGTKIEEVLLLNDEVVVQDYMSQSIADIFPKEMDIRQYWDCCAASGGKAMLFHDHFPKAYLTVSDIRQSILHNLKKRFHSAHIHEYHSFILDIAEGLHGVRKESFDFVLCDAPCSGSGTWARSPENQYFYDENDIAEKQALQVKIAQNAMKAVKKGGYFLYITCSVFSMENEQVISILEQDTHFQIVTSKYFIGYQDRADTMFGTLFRYV